LSLPIDQVIHPKTMSENNKTVAFSVEGKCAIITGAGSGINYCFAKLLLEKNCNVVIADLALRPEAQKLIDDYTTQPRAVFVKTNVVMWNELNNMFDVAEKEFGGADIVRRPHNRPPPTTEIP
jgi:NAD(P)-dependent dehydrogenase (short-subunit alcohol dehydrogenase family)